MLRLLKNESGSIMVMAAAIVLAIVSAVSAWSLVGMVSNSEIMTQYDHDAIQEELLLRSESIRSHLAIEHNSSMYPPSRTVFIQDVKGRRQTVYDIKNKTEQRFVTIFLGQATEQAIAVMSLITAKRGRPRSIRYTSPIQRFSERLVRTQSLAQYQYFSHYEKSENDEGEDDLVKFWGPDVLNGPVHSNDDIYIQHAGGGNNSNRPTFYSLVTTAGRARDYPNGQPYKDVYPGTWEEVFRGGLQEDEDNIHEIVFAPSAAELRQNATWVGNNQDIVYVKIQNGLCEMKFGDIVYTGMQDFDVYSWYPDRPALVDAVVNAGGNWYEDADNIWTNTVAIYDTVWTPGGTVGGGNFSAFWVEDAQLWIEGEVSGKMTWGCADTIFIVDDITYSGTPVGGYPDGFTGFDPYTGLPQYDPNEVNETDFFGLVSEEKILVRYKHRDPFDDNVLRAGNCDGNVYLYGAYAAIGEGEEAIYGAEACHYDGIFTFQYHHGHGSTPSFTAQSPYFPHNDTLYTYIDFHKFIFPTTTIMPPQILGFNLHGNDPVSPTQPCGFPYESPAYVNSYPNNNPASYAVPYGTDWPWYNPVWAESSANIVFERGVLHLYGAIAQRRRGYIHRSGTDPFNHLANNEWDIEDYHYDGMHPSTGYDKDYSYDTRLLVIQPPYYPQVYEGWGEATVSSFSKEAWTYKSPRDW